MLRFVTKREFWDIENSGVLDHLGKPPVWHMKSVQDAIVYNRLHLVMDHSIGEVGGGNSRVLPSLAPMNRCYNFEVYEGRDGGPAREYHWPGVEWVKALVGETEGVFPPGELDVLFSISVVEHIPTPNLEGFFADCHRLLKPGGVAIHLIDLYLHDESRGDPTTVHRLSEYVQPFDRGLFAPEGDVLDPGDVSFSCAYASNPDNVMAMWNRQAPALAERRMVSQGVSLLWVGRR